MTTAEDDVARPASPYTGRYRAFVRDNDDPDRQGRVRCYCPAVMGVEDTRDQWLGWASASYPLASPDGTDGGTACVPEVGVPVWIEFEQGQTDFPVVVGTFVSGKDRNESALPKLGKGVADPGTDGVERTANGVTVPKSTAGTPTYPQNRIIKTSSGAIIEIDETTSRRRIRIRHPSGTFMELTHPGDFVKQVIGNLLVWAGASIKLTAVSQFVIGSGEVLLGSAGASNFVALSNLVATELTAIRSVFNGHTHAFTGAVSGAPPVAAGTTLVPGSQFVGPPGSVAATQVKAI